LAINVEFPEGALCPGAIGCKKRGSVENSRPISRATASDNGQTGQSMTDAIDPAHAPALTALNGRLEERTEKLKNPHPPGSLAWFSWIVARLGGWSGSRGYKPAGPKTIARGIARLDGFIEGWDSAVHSADVRLP
jgi:hypothetical protein